MPFEHFIQKGGKTLRYGFTTGSCAALAAKAATQMLLTQQFVTEVSIDTPKGISVTVPLFDASFQPLQASCGVQKDAGDDPDVTHLHFVYATVQKSANPEIFVDGGKGVGRVTRPGLDQPVGNAAINSTPRRMIVAEVQKICELQGYDGGLEVIISIPQGEELAQKTFNPQLGIEGGLSILGTTGIVEPQSMQALIDCIEVELKAYQAEGKRSVICTPGNYGEAFLQQYPHLQDAPTVKCSNFMGDTIDFAKKLGFQQLLLVGHIGKLVKLAGGMMNTHSQYGDCRMEIFSAHAGLADAPQSVIKALMASVTTDDCIAILEEAGIREQVLQSLIAKIQEHLSRRGGSSLQVGAVLYSNRYGLLGTSSLASPILACLQKHSKEEPTHG